MNVPAKLLQEIEKARSNEEFSEKDFYRINNLLYDYESEDGISSLKESNVYQASIKELFNSKNDEKRVLAYRLIGTARDSAFNDELQKRINSDEPSLLKTWSATALMNNRVAKASDDLFRLMSSSSGDLPVHILINMYITYDIAAVKKTCWKFIDSEKRNEQIMAIQCLANFEQDKALQSKLKEFLIKWDDESKGWVITSMAMQRMENLKPILSEYTGIEHLLGVIISALKDSPTKSDNEYAEQLKKENNQAQP